MNTNIPSGSINQQPTQHANLQQQSQQFQLQLQQLQQQQQQLQLQQQQLQLQQQQFQLQQLQISQSQSSASGSTSSSSFNVSNTSNFTADEIINELNFLKLCKLINEPITTTMILTYLWLYDWDDKSPDKLVDHLEEIPKKNVPQKQALQTQTLQTQTPQTQTSQNQTSRKQNPQKTAKKPKLELKHCFTKQEIEKLLEMKNDPTKMTKYDVTFFYKLIQQATNSLKIANHNDEIWTKDCPSHLIDSLEHLLYLVKDERNNLNHKDSRVLNLKNKEIEDYCDILLQRLQSIIQQLGARTCVDQVQIDLQCASLKTKIESIKNLKHVSSIDKTEVIKCLRERDLLPQLTNLQRAFNDELKSYCPPNFYLDHEGKELKTRDLLSDDQVTIISGEAGHGKTTLTKYILYQKSKLESGNSATIDNLSTFTFVFRVVCRDIASRDVSQFIEGQLPNARQLFPTTSSLVKHLDDVDILWVMDGRDEATAEFHGFFQSLLRNLPAKHRIIITTRPNYLEDLEKEVGNKKMSTMSIKCFAEDDIIDVAEKYLADDISKFNSYKDFYQNSDKDTKELMKTPINLGLFLQLWKFDSIKLKGKMTSHKLFEIVFEEIHNRLVDRIVGRVNIPEKSVKRCVKKWFEILSKIAVEKHFDGKYDMTISKLKEEELSESALDWKLIDADCLSSIFDCEITSAGTNYCFRHNIQIEVLASLYLKKCDQNMLKEIAEKEYLGDYLNKKKSIEPFDFLFECCDSSEYSTIFSIFLKLHPVLQYAKYLLEIKTRDEDYFTALKQKIDSWDQPLTIKLYDHADVVALINLIQSLSSDLQKINLDIGPQCAAEEDNYKSINTILTNYKDRILFQLILKVGKEFKFIPIIRTFKDQQNHQLIKDICIHNLEYEETTIEEISSIENLIDLSIDIYVNNSNYSKSFIAHLASFDYEYSDSDHSTSFNISSQPSSHDSFVSSNNVSTTIQSIVSSTNHSSSSSSSLRKVFNHKYCHAHLNIKCGEYFNPKNLIGDILKLNKMFLSLSVDLSLWFNKYDLPSIDLEENLVSEFLSSTVQVKEVKLYLWNLQKDSIWLKLLNSVHIEGLQLQLYSKKVNDEGDWIHEPTPLLALKRVFEICKFQYLKMKEIYIEIITLNQLNILYKELPSNMITKTTVIVINEPTRPEIEWTSSNVLKVQNRKFKKIEIFRILDSEMIESLKSITNICDIYDSTNSDLEITESLNDPEINEIVMNHLGKAKSQDFLSLNDDWKVFMKKSQIHLSICLQSWKVDPCLLKEKSPTNNLYELLFENQKNLLVEKHEEKTNDKNEMKQRVDKWFHSDFCRVATGLLFNHSDYSDFSKSDKLELLTAVSNCGLIGSECFSIFMDSEVAPIGIDYSFREYQKQALVCLYLKNCNENELRRIAEKGDECSYLEGRNPMDYFFNFLSEFNDNCEFARIFSIFLNVQEKFKFRAVHLIQIRTREQSCFEALMKKVNQPLVLHLIYTADFDAFKNIIQFLPVDIKEIDLVIEIQDKYEMINNIITDYKDHILFQLTLKIKEGYKFIPVIRIFKDHGNQQLMKKIFLQDSDYEEAAIEEISSLKNLTEVSFYVDAKSVSKYSESFLAHMASTDVEYSDSDQSTALLPSASTIKLLHESCHVHFIIEFEFGEPGKVIRDILKVNKKVHSISANIDLWINTKQQTGSLEKDLTSELLSSTVQVKKLKICLVNLPDDSIWLELINCIDIRRLRLELCYLDATDKVKRIYKPTPKPVLNRIIKICQFENVKMKEITFQIMTPDQLSLLYTELPSNTIDKTVIEVQHEPSRPESEWTSPNIPQFKEKQFKRIDIQAWRRPVSFDIEETIEALMAISLSLCIGKPR